MSLGVPENPTDIFFLFYVGGWASIRAALPNALSPVRALVFFIQLATGTSCDAWRLVVQSNIAMWQVWMHYHKIYLIWNQLIFCLGRLFHEIPAKFKWNWGCGMSSRILESDDAIFSMCLSWPWRARTCLRRSRSLVLQWRSKGKTRIPFGDQKWGIQNSSRLLRFC